MTRVPFALLSGGAILAAAATIMSPALAQSSEGDQTHRVDPNQPQNDGSAAASQTVAPGEIAPGADPGTSAANGGVQSNIQATQAVNATNQAQYQSDLDSYGRAVAHHDAQDARYRQHQRAYADAMEAWRVQVAACQRGHTVACNAPAPDPANFE
jgi:hypothetical protein